MKSLCPPQRNARKRKICETHTWDLPSGCRPYLSFVVLEQLNEVSDELLPNELLSYYFCQLSHPPLSDMESKRMEGGYEPR